MSVIVERPLFEHLAVEVLDTEASPFILGSSMLDSGRLGVAGASPVWANWLHKVTRITVQRGGDRDGLAVSNKPGMMYVTIQDYREADPDAPRFVANQGIRLVQITSTGRAVLFTGRIRDMDIAFMQIRPSQPPVPITTLIAVDAVADHDGTTRYGAITPAGGESFGARIARLTGTAAAPIEQPAITEYLTVGGSPIRLDSTVYESSMSNHLTLACNSVGAMWWIGQDGLTRFAPRGRRDDGNEITMRFDGGQNGDPVPGELHGLDLSLSTGSKSQYTVGIAHNLSVKPDEDDPTNLLADESDWTYSQPTTGSSTALLGRLPVVTDTNVVTLGGGPSWFDRVYAMLAPYASGVPKVEAVRWNAQENLEAVPGIEIGRQVNVVEPVYGLHQSQIIGLAYTITPTRWLVDLTLIGAYPL